MNNNENEVIQAKRREVDEAYVKHGVNSPEYEKSFDELHDMNVSFSHQTP